MIRINQLLLLREHAAVIVLLSALSHAYAQSPSIPDIPTQNQSTSLIASSNLSGAVLDASGNFIEGTIVQLLETEHPQFTRKISSDGNGQFTFVNLEPGSYIVEVFAKDMTAYISKPIQLESKSSFRLPNIVLQVSEVTTNIVVMDERAASIEQIRIAEQQRVLSILPNFYSSFDWNAPMMLSKQKYHLAIRTLIDPVTFLSTGAMAGAEQYKNTFPSFGSGPTGYAKRYGSAYATHVSSELLTRAVFPSIFHTDPRYFIMDTGSKKARMAHALSSTFVTRSDDGLKKINFSEILGSFSAAALSYAYYPANERGAHLVLTNGFGNLGGNLLDNLIREFVLNRLTKHKYSEQN